MAHLTEKQTDSKKMTHQECLGKFCDEWNEMDFYPKLYPVHMVPDDFAEEVARAQIDLEVENAVELPEDVQDADAFVKWLRGFSVDSQDLSIVPIQVAAVSRRGQVGVFDIEVSVGPTGYVDNFTDIKVQTMLSGFSRRKTWIDPVMLGKYKKWIESNRTAHLGDQAEERIDLFKKGLQAMIRAKLKDTKEKVARKNKRDMEADQLQSMIDEFKAMGVPLKDLKDSKALSLGVKEGLGEIEFKSKGIQCKVTTKATGVEKQAFADLISAVL